MTPIRAKFRVTSMRQDMNGAKVHLEQICGGIIQDKMFAVRNKYQSLEFASGNIELAIPPGAQEVGMFKPGMDFYVDFVESD